MKITEIERKNIKKMLMYKEFENFPEDEEEFEGESDAQKLVQKKQAKVKKNGAPADKKEKVID